MTSPHAHMCGLYHLPLQYIVIDTGLRISEIKKAMTLLSGLKSGAFAKYDEGTNYVWIPEMMFFQVGPLKETDKRRPMVLRWLRDIPKTTLKAEFYKRYGKELGLDIEGHPAGQKEDPLEK